MGASIKVVSSTNFQGLRSLSARVASLVKENVKVGVIGGEEADGTSLADVMNWIEFGTVNDDGTVRQPERPVLRRTINQNMDYFRAINAANLPRVLDGRMAAGIALDLLGLAAVSKVKQAMVDGPWAPNAPSTIARKGSSKPTIDTGHLRQAMTHVVEPGDA
jgi:hypothetical protein